VSYYTIGLVQKKSFFVKKFELSFILKKRIGKVGAGNTPHNKNKTQQNIEFVDQHL